MISVRTDHYSLTRLHQVCSGQDCHHVDQDSLLLPCVPFECSEVISSKGPRYRRGVQLFLNGAKLSRCGPVGSCEKVLRLRGTDPGTRQCVRFCRKGVESAGLSGYATAQFVRT